MSKLTTNRTAGVWNNTTYQMHIDAARDTLASGGHGFDALTHAIIALVLVQKEALEEGHWGGGSNGRP